MEFTVILVIAPHPDDETLAAGGIIQQAITIGIDVKVIVVTNGDGQVLAPLALHMDLLPRPKDYIADGKQRQTETVKFFTNPWFIFEFDYIPELSRRPIKPIMVR